MLLPLLVGDASLYELAVTSGQVRERVLKERAVLVIRHLGESHREVEGAGDAREGRGACYLHMFSMVEVEEKNKKKVRGYQPLVFSR